MINVPQALAPLADTPLWVCFALVEEQAKSTAARGDTTSRRVKPFIP